MLVPRPIAAIPSTQGTLHLQGDTVALGTTLVPPMPVTIPRTHPGALQVCPSIPSTGPSCGADRAFSSHLFPVSLLCRDAPFLSLPFYPNF